MRRAPALSRACLLAAILLPGLGGCHRAEGTAQRTETWHRLLLNDQPAGFMREVKEAKAGGSLVTETQQRLVVRRADQSLEMEVSLKVEETPLGGIVGFKLLQRMAQNDVTTEGLMRGDSVDLTSTGTGAPRRSTVPFDRRAIGPRRLEAILREKLRRPGDSTEETTFFPEKNASGRLKATLGEEEAVKFPQGPRRLTLRATQVDILPGVTSKEWIDPAGEVWKTSTVLLGMKVETYRSTAEEILREKYASPPEVFYSTSVRPDRPLNDPRNASEVTYRFTLKDGDFASRGIGAMFRGTAQTVLREDSPASRVVRIGRVRPGSALKRPIEPPDGAEGSLAPNAFIQSDDPLIARIAREAVQDATDALETAQRLEGWVRRNVHFKDLKTPFASAKEVAERLEGDCTEHGVLLAALARASGIPSQVVSGLVYHDGAFVGHLWTEVFVDRWTPLDGTRGYGEVGPDHIALAASPLANSSVADLFFDLAQVIGNLKIEILEER